MSTSMKTPGHIPKHTHTYTHTHTHTHTYNDDLKAIIIVSVVVQLTNKS